MAILSLCIYQTKHCAAKHKAIVYKFYNIFTYTRSITCLSFSFAVVCDWIHSKPSLDSWWHDIISWPGPSEQNFQEKHQETACKYLLPIELPWLPSFNNNKNVWSFYCRTYCLLSYHDCLLLTTTKIYDHSIAVLTFVLHVIVAVCKGRVNCHIMTEGI